MPTDPYIEKLISEYKYQLQSTAVTPLQSEYYRDKLKMLQEYLLKEEKSASDYLDNKSS